MPSVRLTPTLVKDASCPEGKEREIYWDQAIEGLGLVVMPKGHKRFVIQYRHDGRSRRMTLKSKPGVAGLDDVRKEAKGELGKVAKDRDPLSERRKKAAEPHSTFKAVSERHLLDRAHLRSIDDRRDILQRLFYPGWEHRQIATIQRSEIVKRLDCIKEENGPAAAGAAWRALSCVFNWHGARQDAFFNPMSRGMTDGRAQIRTRILDDNELRLVWTTAAERKGPFDYLVQFILMTATRKLEAARISREEIDGPVWTIPAARYKSEIDFALPLTDGAIEILRSMPFLGRYRDRGFIFTTDGKRAIAGFSKFKRQFDERCGVVGWRIHDLRRTARSLMSRAGVDPDHAERVLGHVIPGIRGVYDRYAFLKEKREALEALAQQIDYIVNPKDNVVEILRKKA
jgi:integrase